MPTPAQPDRVGPSRRRRASSAERAGLARRGRLRRARGARRPPAGTLGRGRRPLASSASSSFRGAAAAVAEDRRGARRRGRARAGPGGAADGVWWCPITPERVLAVTPPERTASVRDELDRGRVGATPLRLGDRADHALRLERGRRAARARDVRPQHGARPAPASASSAASFAPVSVARTPGMVLRERDDDRSCTCSAPGYAALRLDRVRRRRRAPRRPGGRHRRAGASRPGGGPARCVTSSASAACGAGPPSFATSYDVVIVGGGSHGLATAYYLARDHGITDVCVLEQNYIGSGRRGAQHDHPALQLQDPRGRALLRRLGEALRGPRGRARLQPALLASRGT